MEIKKNFRRAIRQGRILRYRTYRKAGVGRHRRGLDLSFFLILLLCVGFLPFFVLRPEPPPVPCLPDETPPIQESVHPDLGDDPVIQEQYASLQELEKRVRLKELDMTAAAMERGDTLIGLLSAEKIPASERVSIIDSLELLVDLRGLKPGLSILFFKTKQGEVLGLSLQIREGETIAVLKEKNGAWTPFSHAGRVETKTHRIQGTVERTFAGSAAKFGVPENVIAQVTGVLDGEIDFSQDMRAGDSFDIIYEVKTTPSGLELGDRQLLFIGLKMEGKAIHRYAYTDKAGLSFFYDARGRSGETLLLKRPLKARGRLTSGYGWRRHPVLLYETFHHGVDLAAPMNTPIMAAADGVITQLGRKGAYGKYIRIRHASGYETAYGHLNGYRQDLKVRSQVRRGEVVAYLGSTGRSTGPHVHFEVWKNGKTANPFGRNAIPSKQLSGFEQEQFFSFAEALHPDFKQHQAGNIPPPPARKPF